MKLINHYDINVSTLNRWILYEVFIFWEGTKPLVCKIPDDDFFVESKHFQTLILCIYRQ